MGRRRRVDYSPPAFLKAWRNSFGLSLTEVAKLIALLQPEISPPLDQSAIGRWESGETAVTLQALELLAKVYNTTPDRLFFSPNDKRTPELMRRAFTILSDADADKVDWWITTGERLLDKK